MFVVSTVSSLMQSTMRRLLKTIDSISEYTGRIISYLTLFVFLIVLYNVTARYAFNEATVWADEIATYIFGASAALAGAYVLKYGGHVRMDVLYNVLSSRKRAIIDAITSGAFFLFIVIFVWVSGNRAILGTLRLERSGSVFNSPYWPFLWVLPIGAGLMGIQGIAKFVRNCYFAITNRELR